MAMPDARDARISELEAMVDNLEDTVAGQQVTIDALQQTNQLMAEQLEETSKQLQSSNQQFLTSRGLYNASDGDLQRSLSIDQTATSGNTALNSFESSDAGLYASAQSIQVDEDDVYSSGDDIQTYKTKISDDHELLPLKQGTLKKKSETMHRYNNRYVILYPSFLLYYDQCPIKTDNKYLTDINHPKGSIYLRNYHVAIRRDIKKKRFDITFVPHQSAVSMGLAATDARLRFRCKSLNELSDWTEKIRTAITSANSGFIKYDVRTDFIYNDMSNLGKIMNDDEISMMNDEDMKEDNKKNTKMFDVNDLKAMLKKEDELLTELASKNRLISKMEHELESLKTDLAIKETEVASEQTVFERQKQDLKAKMIDIKEHEKTLKEEISNLRARIGKLERKNNAQHMTLKQHKLHEQDIQRNIAIMKKWNTKMEENSLEYLGNLYPKSASKQLLENCQKGCMVLLEETYKELMHNDEQMKKRMDSDCKANNQINRSKQLEESKICSDMMCCFTKILRKNIKGTINYVNLQMAHHGVMDDMRQLKQTLTQYQDEDGNSLQDNALIMASMTAKRMYGAAGRNI
eukprot:315540_1